MIAHRLRITRLATGWNQAQFCRVTGISQQAWNNYERDAVRISVNAALKLCAALGITLDWVFRGNLQAGVPFDLATKIQEVERREREAKRTETRPLRVPV